MMQHKTYKKEDVMKDFETSETSKKEHYIWSYVIRPVRSNAHK